jgi:uncharacterized protein
VEKIRLGRTGLMVSKLGFGGIPIQRLSEADAIAVVKKCAELGVTFFDTANGYTTSEERIGKALAGQWAGKIIATKSQARNVADVKKHLDLSLQRMNIKSIDLYQLHNISDENAMKFVLDPAGPLPMLKDAKKAGLIKHIGVTSHNKTIARKLVESDKFETLMFPFNFLSPEVAEELLPLIKQHDMGFIAMKPLAGGMLSNGKVALKYLWQFPDVVSIPGIEKLAEIEELAAVANNPKPITTTERKEMKRLAKELGKHFCHRCDYCQPCTQGIPISTVLQIESFIKRTPAESLIKGPMSALLDKSANCSECGECETRCPYKLPIKELVRKNADIWAAFKKQYAKTA